MSKLAFIQSALMIAGSFCLISPALADDNAGNIFTTPSGGNQTPKFAEGGAPGARHGHEGREPELKQVMNLPDLTPEQKQQIKDIYKQGKEQTEPIKEQLQKLREGHQGNEQQTMADADSKEKFMDLRRQMRDARRQTWEQVKKVLNEKQLQEVEAMRRGEMQPSTFNPPKQMPQPSEN